MKAPPVRPSRWRLFVLWVRWQWLRLRASTPFIAGAAMLAVLGILGAAIVAKLTRRDTLTGSITKAKDRLEAEAQVNRELANTLRLEAERRIRQEAITQEHIAVTEKMAEISTLDAQHIADEWNRLRNEGK